MSSIDLTTIPNLLASKLNLSLFSAQILTTIIFLAIFLIPTLILTRQLIPHVVITFLVLSFCMSLGWLPIYVFLIITIVVALMIAMKFRDVITGSGD